MDAYANHVCRLNAELFPARRRTRLVRSARQYIDRHYQHPLDLSAIAARACLSPYHFIRLFQRHYGQTPGQYLREARLRRARELLLKGLSVTETCIAVGYTSTASFSLLFRRNCGTSPSRYRKAILDKRTHGDLPIIDRWQLPIRRPL
jgi:AraC-like DNA-binding protein